jgi:hypothetical protein
LVLAGRGEELLGAQRIASGDERAVAEALLSRWERAVATGALRDVAECAAAFASWAAGERRAAAVVVDRAVDLTLRAGAVACDAHRVALLRSKPAEMLGRALERSAGLAHALAGAPTWTRRGLVALDLEDVAARSAGEALVAVLLAGEMA